MQSLPLNQFTRPGDMDSTHDTFTHCPAPHFQDTHNARYTVLNTFLPCIRTSYILHASLPCTRRKGYSPCILSWENDPTQDLNAIANAVI
jgi:hypothetical protein